MIIPQIVNRNHGAGPPDYFPLKSDQENRPLIFQSFA